MACAELSITVKLNAENRAKPRRAPVPRAAAKRVRSAKYGEIWRAMRANRDMMYKNSNIQLYIPCIYSFVFTMQRRICRKNVV